MSDFKGLPIPAKELMFVCRMCTRMADQWSQGQTTCHEKTTALSVGNART
jgi:hypothetical protein